MCHYFSDEKATSKQRWGKRVGVQKRTGHGTHSRDSTSRTSPTKPAKTKYSREFDETKSDIER